jgi:Domain of unknown function (DUF4783)
MNKKILLAIIFFCLLKIQVHSQVPEVISLALKNGNSPELSKHFNNEIELIVLDIENVYSKSQAQVILKDFFKEYNVENFYIKHQGDKDNMHYVIGDLVTSNKTFRISFILKTINNQLLIHQLRIEDA